MGRFRKEVAAAFSRLEIAGNNHALYMADASNLIRQNLEPIFRDAANDFKEMEFDALAKPVMDRDGLATGLQFHARGRGSNIQCTVTPLPGKGLIQVKMEANWSNGNSKEIVNSEFTIAQLTDEQIESWIRAGIDALEQKGNS